jgi:protein SCO1/2
MKASRNAVLQVCVLALALGGAGLPGIAAAQSGHDGHAGHAQHADHTNHTNHADHSKHADHTDHANHDKHVSLASQPDRQAEDAVVRFANVRLLDQHNRERRLESDVIGDRIVVMDFVYTTCTTVCPVVSAIMGEVQARLGERVGRDVALVSMTVDPVRDTPSKLREYAQARGAGPGWSWLTGSASAVNETLKGLGTWTPDFEDHPVVMMVGDGRSGKWTRYYGFADPAALVAQVESLTAARAAHAESLTAAHAAATE